AHAARLGKHRAHQRQEEQSDEIYAEKNKLAYEEDIKAYNKGLNESEDSDKSKFKHFNITNDIAWLVHRTVKFWNLRTFELIESTRQERYAVCGYVFGTNNKSLAI
ncbi:hypothetical protein S245_003994, partial [Arachis hypogaea]